jgi:hypothetical protein
MWPGRCYQSLFAHPSAKNARKSFIWHGMCLAVTLG